MATSAEPLGAPSPFGGLSGKGAADILQGLASAALFTQPTIPICHGQLVDHVDAEAAGCDGLGPSRKDKSLGLLCDNFLKNFASGGSQLIELEPVAEQLSVGRRRIYDIVNVLESLSVVSKHKASVYSWLGMDNLPATIEAIERDWAAGRPDDVQLLTDAANPGAVAESPTEKENAANLAPATAPPQAVATDDAGAAPSADASAKPGPKSKASDKDRKEKSIRELSLKFIGLFMQAVRSSELGGVLSLEQAARSLLKHELRVEAGAAAHVEPDANAMKTKVRRLYDICNVLTSLKMIEKVKLRGTNKPAFKWLGVTPATHLIFDASDARSRVVKQYGGGPDAAPAQARAGAKRSLAGNAGGGRRIAPKTAAALDPHFGQALCTPGGWVQGSAVPAADAEALVALQNLQGHGDALLQGHADMSAPRAAAARTGAPIARQETEVCYQRTAVALSGERAEHAAYLQLLQNRSGAVASTHPVVVAATAVDAPPKPGVAVTLPVRLDPEAASGAGKLVPRACALTLTYDDWPGSWGAASETSGDDTAELSPELGELACDRSDEGSHE